ncbi:snRNA-activating protein complex subunit 4 isoform X1 [Cylas formicarius]|uniref:snRNA-activating protein complex subunit 4 isoform X1 n=1 Tax=Cylas formicarius TaxID=197179 RepID=UPI0029588D10|nr:snRNA-activating protein complex subunit 4 isoform X1 [Cylas formicarius]
MFKGEIEDIEKLDAAIRQHESDSFINYEEVSDNDEDDQDFDTCADISALKDYVPSALLTDDEKQLIDSCRDPDLKLLLELNRSKNVKLMQLYTKIRHLLMECQSNIVAKSRQIDSCSDQFKRVINRIWRFGYPYFKSTDNYPCPMNEYVARKEENRELPFYDMVPTNKWNRRDINRLKRGVTFCFKAGRDMETKKKITQLEEDILGERRTDKIAELKGLVAKLNETINSDDQELPTESSDRLMDWARLSATFLRSKYSSQECRSFWYLYQDPRINKTPWSLDERKKLDKLVRKYKHQNWERIASDLGTSRSALITCTHYFTGNTLRPGKFTPEEDAFLVEMVENHSVGDYVPWAKIAHFFKNHTRKQIFYRWRYYLNGRGKITKGPFTDAEDVLLMVLVDRFGTSFAKCQKYFPTRSMSQLKARYTTNLKVNWKKGSFTVEEDEKLLAYVAKHGSGRWAALSSEMNRSPNQLRHRHRLMVQYLEDNPGAAIRDAPRKIERSRGNNYPFLRWVADRYRDADVPTLAEIRATIGATDRDSKEEATPSEIGHGDVDKMIVEFFHGSEAASAAQALDASRAVGRVLTLLGARLDVPADFASDGRLDATDVALLRPLCDALRPVDGRQVIRADGHLAFRSLMPPTAASLIGYRALAGVASSPQATWCVEAHLGRLPDATRAVLVAERDLFYRRFRWTFKLTAVAAVAPPSSSLVALSRTFSGGQVGQVKRTYARKRRDASGADAKRQKIERNDGRHLADELKRKIRDEIVDFGKMVAASGDDLDRDAEDLAALEAALRSDGGLEAL